MSPTVDKKHHLHDPISHLPSTHTISLLTPQTHHPSYNDHLRPAAWRNFSPKPIFPLLTTHPSQNGTPRRLLTQKSRPNPPTNPRHPNLPPTHRPARRPRPRRLRRLNMDNLILHRKLVGQPRVANHLLPVRGSVRRTGAVHCRAIWVQSEGYVGDGDKYHVGKFLD